MQNEILKQTVSVLVDNEPGVLARVIGLISGRGYNIDSLTVAEVDAEKLPFPQINFCQNFGKSKKQCLTPSAVNGDVPYSMAIKQTPALQMSTLHV